MTEHIGANYGAFYSILTTVRDSLVTELQRRGASAKRVSIVPGAIAWDDCDSCGLLALAATNYFLTDEFPIEVMNTYYREGALFAASFVVQLIRCAPQPIGTNTAPSVDALDTTAQQVLDDGFTLICVVTSVLRQMVNTLTIADYMVRQLDYIGPEGACVGSQLSFVVGLDR